MCVCIVEISHLSGFILPSTDIFKPFQIGFIQARRGGHTYYIIEDEATVFNVDHGSAINLINNGHKIL